MFSNGKQVWAWSVKNATKPVYHGTVESETNQTVTIRLYNGSVKPEFRTFFRKNIVSKDEARFMIK